MANKKKIDPPAPPSPLEQPPTSALFPIVGIGASAGGLEAFETFFEAMPPTSGCAFVIVAHLDPTHTSLLPELLQKHTRMQVFQVEDGMVVQPNTIHIIPPNKDLKLSGNTLLLTERQQPHGSNLPIDSFFRSLALEHGARAVCIVLTGTGTDGTLGLRAIKGELGMAMVQDIKSAQYDGMPKSAIATQLADYVLPPHEMPAALIRYIQHARDPEQQQKTSAQLTTSILEKVYTLLRSHTQNDFSLYKENTIFRRIERRMAVHQLTDAAQYVRYLQENEREIEILFKEVLIGVTSFFRDPQAFAALYITLLDYLKDKPRDYNFRVWVPGCSTGEEAYSIAMLLQECMEQLKSYFNVQIFATDIDETAIQAARIGFYPLSISSDLSGERLSQFFQQEEQGYQVKKSIREMLVFAPQNLIQDPPFTKLDLLSCRNLLIYFSADLQKKLLPIFHYSLKANGTLFLGSSETTSAASDFYRTKDKKAKLFAANAQVPASYQTTDFPAGGKRLPLSNAANKDQHNDELSSIRLVETILQQSDTPPCVLVDGENNVVYVHGRTGRFLEPASGRANNLILDMARPGLRTALAAAMHEAHISRKSVVRKELRIEHLLVNLRVTPLLEQAPLHDLLLVSFDAVDPAEDSGKKPQDRRNEAGAKSADELARELQSTRDHLQSTIEELETANEELKSTNEELQSTNEELQSTNEELETSKEELQSLNEESTTVNAELQSHIDELTHAHDDMKNLLDSTQIATLFLDIELRIHRFTPKMTETIPLTQSDIGRLITDLAINLEGIDLKSISQRVLDTLAPKIMEVSTSDQRFFTMRVLPYRTVRNVIDGVVITLEDITQRKNMENELHFSEDRYRLLLKNTALVVAHIDRELRYSWIHNAHPDFSPAAYMGKRDDEIADNEGSKKLLQLKERVLRTGVAASEVISFPLSSGEHSYSISAEPLKDITGATIGLTTVSFDLSDRKESAQRQEN